MPCKKIANSFPHLSVVIYLKPLLYEDSRALSSYDFTPESRWYEMDGNPCRMVNGSFCYGEELENPTKEELDSYSNEYMALAEMVGFEVSGKEPEVNPVEMRYLAEIGLGGDALGTLTLVVRVSDNLFAPDFPEELKASVLEYLTMDRIIDSSAYEAGIDFQIEKVAVGDGLAESWHDAEHRIYDLLRTLLSRFHPITEPPSRGVFWVVGDMLIAYPFRDGEHMGAIAKSGNTYNHKKLWEEVGPRGKPFDYYPRGRVDVSRQGKATIYLSPQINDEKWIYAIKFWFGITGDDFRVIEDHSAHYRCYLDG